MALTVLFGFRNSMEDWVSANFARLALPPQHSEAFERRYLQFCEFIACMIAGDPTSYEVVLMDRLTRDFIASSRSLAYLLHEEKTHQDRDSQTTQTDESQAAFLSIETPMDKNDANKREKKSATEIENALESLKRWFLKDLRPQLVLEAAGFVVLSVYAGYTIAMYYATNDAATAALKQTTLNAKQFELAERPKLAIKVVFKHPTLIDNGGMHISLEASVTNGGQTPGIKTFAAANVVPLQMAGPDAAALRQQTCDEAKSRALTSRFAFTVYPEKDGASPSLMDFQPLINRRDLGSGIVPLVAICYAYHTGFSDSVYTTGFTSAVYYIPDPTSADRHSVPIQDGSIPDDRLDFYSTNHGGGPEITPE